MDTLLEQLLENDQEYKHYINEQLKTWGNEMENKDHQRNPLKQESLKQDFHSQEIKKYKVEESNRAKKEALEDIKIRQKCVTFADWDKYDADKECEKIDDDSDSNSDSLVDGLKDQASIEKDVGNKYVKAGQWNEALKCYTKAIRYYAYDPIFYANRALCFLKTKQMEKAEQDCNISLKLDHTYVKAYQRRAAARESLGKFEEARLDLLRVLELEPKNSESKIKLEKLTETINTLGPQKPISMFGQSRQHLKRQSPDLHKHTISDGNYKQSKNNEIDLNIPECIWPSGVVIDSVKPIQKPPHMRSTKPLKRIAIKEINSALPESCDLSNSILPEVPNVSENSSASYMFNTALVKVIEHKSPIYTAPEESVKEQEKFSDINIPTLTPPKTSVQFHLLWKQLKGNNDKRNEYLRMINPSDIPRLFKDSLESEVFSEILLVLAEDFIKNRDVTYEYLLNLSKMKRFSALSMFLTLSDKNSLWKLFNHMKEFEGRSKEEIDYLIVKYEL